MSENLERAPELRPFGSDRERLWFINGSIRRTIKPIRLESARQLKEATEESHWSGEESRGLEIIRKRADFAIMDALDKLRTELADDERLKEYIPEINTLIEATRIMFIQKWLVKYKEYQLAKNAPELTTEEIVEQDKMREDITECRALLQWYVLQRENNPLYIKDFLAALNDTWGGTGFAEHAKQRESLLRGLKQELGVYKLLKKHLFSVTPATPKEDAHYSIDFWAETMDGEKIMIQAKSSGMFGGDGIFGEAQIKELTDKIAQEPNATLDYSIDSEGVGHASRLVRALKLGKNAEVAKKYARGKGIKNPQYFIIVSNPGKFEDLTGEPKPGQNKKLEEQLESFRLPQTQ